MTPEEINIAIAEWSGEIVPEIQRPDSLWPDEKIARAYNRHCLPDYYRDLNAVAKAELSLLFSRRKAYRRILRECIIPGKLVAEDEICHATAPQRCEAILRMLGLWKEPK